MYTDGMRGGVAVGNVICYMFYVICSKLNETEKSENRRQKIEEN